MDIMLTTILSELLKVVAIVAAGFLVAVAQRLIGTAKMRKITEELENKREIINAVVLFVQQVYTISDGEEKFSIAYKTAAEWLTDKGLSFTDEELQSLIESSIKLFKKEFGEDWNEKIGPTQ